MQWLWWEWIEVDIRSQEEVKISLEHMLYGVPQLFVSVISDDNDKQICNLSVSFIFIVSKTSCGNVVHIQL